MANLFESVENNGDLDEDDYFRFHLAAGLFQGMEVCAEFSRCHFHVEKLCLLKLSLSKSLYDAVNERLFLHTSFSKQLGSLLLCESRLIAFEAREVVISAIHLSLKRDSKILQEQLQDLVAATSAHSLEASCRPAYRLAVCDLLAGCCSRRRVPMSLRSLHLRFLVGLSPSLAQHWTAALSSCDSLYTFAISRVFRKLARLIGDEPVDTDQQRSGDPRCHCCLAVLTALDVMASSHAFNTAALAESIADHDSSEPKVADRRRPAELLTLAVAYRLWSPCMTAGRAGTSSSWVAHHMTALSRRLLNRYMASRVLRPSELQVCYDSVPAISVSPRERLLPPATVSGHRVHLLVALHAAAMLLCSQSVSRADEESAVKALVHLQAESRTLLGDNRPLWALSVDILFGADDLLVEGLLCLLTVHLCIDQWQKSSDSCEETRTGLAISDPHATFNYLLQKTGFNHQIFLDWLISPETKFLVYFVKYVKYLASATSNKISLSTAADTIVSGAGLSLLTAAYAAEPEEDYEDGAQVTAERCVATAAGSQPAFNNRSSATVAPSSRSAVTSTLGYPQALVLSRLLVTLRCMQVTAIFPYNVAPLLRLLEALDLPPCATSLPTQESKASAEESAVAFA